MIKITLAWTRFDNFSVVTENGSGFKEGITRSWDLVLFFPRSES